MQYSNVTCYIYRAETDESDGDMATIGILIPRHKVVVPNQSENVFWVSKERKLKVYENVYERFGEPPEELMLPNIEFIQMMIPSGPMFVVPISTENSKL